MNRRSVRIGVALGALAGGAAALVRSVRSRRSAAPAPPPPAWPPLHLDEVTPDPVLPERDRDEVVAPGPDPQPERQAEPEPVAAPAPTPPLADEVVVVAAAGIGDEAVPTEDASTDEDDTDAIPVVRPEDDAGRGTTWVEAFAGVCPATHPVKAKLSSNIFHLPGMVNYDRTRADRCYVNSDAAEADGMRIAKR